MATSVPVNGYAVVADYELRTGTDVPTANEPTIQQRLNDASALIDIYLGPCKDEVAAAYPEVLKSVTVAQVYRVSSIPVGVRSESVGGTSVSYDTTTAALALGPAETDLLDALMDSVCGSGSARGDGVGQVGVTYGGAPDTTTGWPEDVDLWVLSGYYR